jgi:Tol biopolymer transport system component
MMNFDGSAETRLTNNSESAQYPIWDPDGKQISYTVNGDLYIMDADGTNQTNLTSQPGPYIYEFDWSKDGTKITFRGESGGQNIYVINIDGTGLINLTNSSTVDLDPKWSPNNNQIAYSCGIDICVMDDDGSNVQNLTNSLFSDMYPSWSSDGKEIAFVSDKEGNYDIYTINVDGSGLNRITTSHENDWLPVWQP